MLKTYPLDRKPTPENLKRQITDAIQALNPAVLVRAQEYAKEPVKGQLDELHRHGMGFETFDTIHEGRLEMVLARVHSDDDNTQTRLQDCMLLALGCTAMQKLLNFGHRKRAALTLEFVQDPLTHEIELKMVLDFTKGYQFSSPFVKDPSNPIAVKLAPRPQTSGSHPSI